MADITVLNRRHRLSSILTLVNVKKKFSMRETYWENQDDIYTEIIK